MRFDPSDRESVLRRAEGLVGRTASDIASESAGTWDPNSSKGSVGLLIERHFGLEANQDAGPDLIEAGIEIKSVPLRSIRQNLRSKERTSITMIDYHRVVREPFEGTGLDLKTRLTLYVFFLWSHGAVARAEDQLILRVLLHDRNDLDLLALTEAYDHVRDVSRKGNAHLLSEGDTAPVGACTKGAAGATRTQPFSSVPARPRAFAWRPAYTTRLYHSGRSEAPSASLVMPADGVPARIATPRPSRVEQAPRITAIDDLVARIERRLLALTGRSVEELRARYAPTVKKTAKNVGAATFRRILSADDEDLTVAIDTLGITVRVTRVEPTTLRPYEAVSFSPFDFLEVAETPWDESEVLATLGRILFIVLQAPRGAKVGEARLRSVIMWSADPGSITKMEQEYEMFRRAFRDTPPSGWPRSSKTEVLHVRPHGRDGRDVIPLPSGGTHVRSSLWLNQSFVQDLILRHGA